MGVEVRNLELQLVGFGAWFTGHAEDHPQKPPTP